MVRLVLRLTSKFVVELVEFVSALPRSAVTPPGPPGTLAAAPAPAAKEEGREVAIGTTQANLGESQMLAQKTQAAKATRRSMELSKAELRNLGIL